MSELDKYLNANGYYTELQNVPPATHATSMQLSQNKVHRIRVFVKSGFETSVYIGALSTFWIQKKSVYVIFIYSNFRIS
jgi:hypothetical protein